MRARDGFTLLEAVVSLAILSLVGIAALGAVGSDLDSAARSRAALAAAALAEDRLEAVRLLDFEELGGLPDSVSSGRFEPPFEAFTWTVASEPVNDVRGLYDVRIEVMGEGAARTLSARIYKPVQALTASGGGAGGMAQGLEP